MEKARHVLLSSAGRTSVFDHKAWRGSECLSLLKQKGHSLLANEILAVRKIMKSQFQFVCVGVLLLVATGTIAAGVSAQPTGAATTAPSGAPQTGASTMATSKDHCLNCHGPFDKLAAATITISRLAEKGSLHTVTCRTIRRMRRRSQNAVIAISRTRCGRRQVILLPFPSQMSNGAIRIVTTKTISHRVRTVIIRGYHR